MRNQIIEEIYRDTQYINYCRKVCNDSFLADDLFQYLILYLMEMPEGKLEALYNEGNLRNYIARIIYCSINGNRSQFLKEIKDSNNILSLNQCDFFLLKSENENENNKHLLLDKIDEFIDKEEKRCNTKKIYPVSLRLFEIYKKEGSCKAVSKLTGINYKTVSRHIKIIINKLKMEI